MFMYAAADKGVEKVGRARQRAGGQVVLNRCQTSSLFLLLALVKAVSGINKESLLILLTHTHKNRHRKRNHDCKILHFDTHIDNVIGFSILTTCSKIGFLAVMR